jgi:putative DNA primase/helicase
MSMHASEDSDEVVSPAVAQIRDIVDSAPDEKPNPPCDEDEIKRLAKLKPIEYERERKTVAKTLGIGVRVLDAAIKAARSQNTEAIAIGPGRPVELRQFELWPYQVEAASILSQISSTLREYVIISNEQADTLALWVLHTHTHDVSDVSPKIALKSAQKRCGKTQLVTVLERIVANPLYVSGITPAALLRIIETLRPTLLLDEIDATMKADRGMAEALRGILNSGFNRAGARCILNVTLPGGGYEPRQFSTWAPQLLSGIGQLPDTVRDRSIEIEMIRKRPGETVRRLRRRDGADLDELGRKAARWAHDSLEQLRTAVPSIPFGLDDRAADAWEPLLAIAALAGTDWAERACAAALGLSAERAREDDEITSLLLRDIQQVFATREGENQIRSGELVSALVALEERPWGEFGRARKPITPSRLASLLRGYKIRPGTIRTGPADSDTAKGYKLEDFAEVFSRYLPRTPKQSVTPSQLNDSNGFNGNQPVT